MLLCVLEHQATFGLMTEFLLISCNPLDLLSHGLDHTHQQLVLVLVMPEKGEIGEISPLDDVINRYGIIAFLACQFDERLAEMVPVLKPGGYLVHSDLMFPQPIARLGTMLAGRSMGFPTRTALQSFIAQQKLGVMKQSHSLAQFEGVFRKPVKVAGP
jgi:hypothetical protein